MRIKLIRNNNKRFETRLLMWPNELNSSTLGVHAGFTAVTTCLVGSLSPSCFNREEEEGEEEEALWYQPKLVDLRKFLVPLLIQRYIESLHFSATFGNLLPVVQQLPCREFTAGCCTSSDGKTQAVFFFFFVLSERECGRFLTDTSSLLVILCVFVQVFKSAV